MTRGGGRIFRRVKILVPEKVSVVCEGVRPFGFGDWRTPSPHGYEAVAAENRSVRMAAAAA